VYTKHPKLGYHGLGESRGARPVFRFAARPYVLCKVFSLCPPAGKNGHLMPIVNGAAPLPLHVRWLSGEGYSDAHRVVGRHSDEVRNLALAAYDGDTAVVAVDGSGVLQAWSLRTAARIGPAVEILEPRRPYCLALTTVAGRLTAAVAKTTPDDEEGIRFFDVALGFEPLPAIKQGRSFTSFVLISGELVAITHGYSAEPDRHGRSQLGVRVWRYGASGWSASEVAGLPAYTEEIFDSHYVGDRVSPVAVEGDRLYVIDALAGSVTGEIRLPREMGPRMHLDAALGFGMLGDRPVAAMVIDRHHEWVNYDGALRVFALDNGDSIWEVRHDYFDGEVVTIGRLDDRDVVVTGGSSGVLRVFDLQDGTALGPPLRGHSGRILQIAISKDGARDAVISAGEDGSIRVWPAPQPGSQARAWPTSDTDSRLRPFALAVGTVHGRDLLAVHASSDPGPAASSIRVLEGDTGILRWDLSLGNSWPVVAAAFSKLDGADVLIVAQNDGSVSMWRVGDGDPVQVEAPYLDPPQDAYNFGDPDYEQPYSLALGEIAGDPVVALGSVTAISFWNLRTHRKIGPGLDRDRFGIYSRLAFGYLRGRTVIAFLYNQIDVFDVLTGKKLASGGAFPARVVTASFVHDGSRTWIGGAAEDNNSAVLWQIDTSDNAPVILPGHVRQVQALTGGKLAGKLVFASGDTSGTVRLWSSDGTPWQAVDIGKEIIHLSLHRDKLIAGTVEGDIVSLQLAEGELHAPVES